MGYKIKKTLVFWLMKFFQLFPINNKKIVFSSFRGKYNDAPKTISDALLFKNIKQVWITTIKSLPKGIVGVKPKSIKAIFHLATAKIWVDNSRKESWVSKRKKQFYIQTWHGGVAIKKVEKDAEKCLPKIYVESAKKDSKMINLFVSESEWRTNNIRSSFWYDGPILTGGGSKI